MNKFSNQYYEGERILYGTNNLVLDETTFGHGESPLKETNNIVIKNSIFQWKYPLWYSNNITVENTIFETMARSGIWYTKNITIKNSSLQAPKLFRRSSKIDLDHVHFSNAEETMWSCKDIKITNTEINGDYFGKDSENVYLDHVNVIGNYVFDGAKNVEVHNSTFVSKDAFWNCEKVTVYDSTIDGEYLAWNTKNIKFINCKIESEQGLNYIDHLEMKNTSLIHSDLVFEYVSNLDAEITTEIKSVKNPISGKLSVPAIQTLILDPEKVDPNKTKIDCTKVENIISRSDQNQKAKEA